MTDTLINDRIFLSPPHLGDSEVKYVKEAFASNYIAPLGPQVDMFERKFSEVTCQPYCVALSSGTAAIHLALQVLGVGYGDLVLASSLTFIGSVAPVFHLGAELVFVDSEPLSWNMDPLLLKEELERCQRYYKLPSAVIPTDLYGQCCNLEVILDICRNYNVPVICDSAEALGAQYNDKHAGSGAAAAIYSFNGNKIITTSGGGMLASADRNLIEKARFLSQQARDPAPHYEHSQIGYNYRMSNILAAIGLGQLEILDKKIEVKRDVYRRYHEAFEYVDGIEMMPTDVYGRSTNWLSVILVNPKRFGNSRDDVIHELERNNIESRPVWKPMHMQPVFEGYRNVGGAVSEKLFEEGLCIPSGTNLSINDQNRIIELILNLHN